MFQFIIACCIIYWLVASLITSAKESNKPDPYLDLRPTTRNDIPDNLFQ